MSVLCLTRYPEESVIMDIGETRIRITVIESRKSGMARLAIEAPLHVRIWRAELLERKPANEGDDNPLHPNGDSL